MALQINQYTKTRTAGTVTPEDLMDFDSTDDTGSTYESAKIEVSQFLGYLNSNVSNIYNVDGTIISPRTLTAGGNSTTWLGGNVVVQMVNLTTDYAFLVRDNGGVEKGRLGYDQDGQSGEIELTDATNIFFNAKDGVVSSREGYWLNNIKIIHDGDSSLSSIFLGQQAGQSNTSGGLRNVGVGRLALFDNISGDGCTAIGYQSLANSTGNSNTAVGSDSATAIVLETGVTAVGERALNNTTGSSNTGIGHLTGSGVVGANNTFLGKYAGWTGIGQTSAVTGSIAIGANSFTDSSNQMTLGIINEFVFGVPTRNLGTPITIRSTDIATGGLDTSNIGHLTIAGGVGTGTGLGAEIRFRTAPADTVSTTNPNSLIDAVIIQQDGVTVFKSFTVATLPNVVAGGQIFVSDETGGAVMAYSDGVNWRRVSDGVIVS